MRLSDLARSIPLRVVRDGDFESLGLLTSQSHRMLSCLHDPAKAGDWTSNESVSCVITTEDLALSVPEKFAIAVSPAPRETFLDIQVHLGANTDFYGRDEPSDVSLDAAIHKGAHVSPHNVRIARGCVVESGAVIMGRVSLAEGVVVRAGAVVGAEGFHPVPYRDAQRTMPHLGSVSIDRQAEIGALAVVCRSVFSSPTEIGEGSVLGPLVYIAHGVKLGRACRIAASARVCGSSIVGAGVFIGPNAVVSNQIRIGDGARVSIGSVVVRDVAPGQTVTGHFAIEHSRFMEAWKRLFR